MPSFSPKLNPFTGKLQLVTDITGVIDGSGQNGYLGVWADADTMSYNSNIFVSGGRLVAAGGIDTYDISKIVLDGAGDRFASIESDGDDEYGWGVGTFVLRATTTSFGFVFQNGEDITSGTSVKIPYGRLYVNPLGLDTSSGDPALTVNGRAYFSTASGAVEDGFIVYDSENTRIAFRVDNNDGIVVLQEAGGYLSIGKRYPDAPFNVAGYTHFDDVVGIGVNPSGATKLQLQGTGNLQSWSYNGGAGNTWSLNISSGGSYILTPSDANDAFFIDFSDANKMLQIDNRGVMVGLSAGIWVGQGFDTRLARSSAGVFEIDNGTAGVYRDLIMRNLTARVVPRVGTATSSATPTINTDNVDYYQLTAQAASITSMTTNLSGTPNNAQKLWLSIVGTSTFDITWGTGWESGSITLPTTGAITTARLDLGFVWNAATSKWRIVSLS